jgi:hypothetical protein
MFKEGIFNEIYSRNTKDQQTFVCHSQALQMQLLLHAPQTTPNQQLKNTTFMCIFIYNREIKTAR